MPQMDPINWLSLFFMFSITYLIFCILNYYNYFIINPTNTDKILPKSTNYLNWKW